MINISILKEAVDICKDTGLDSNSVLDVFTVYNHIEHLESYMETFTRTLPPFGSMTFTRLEQIRNKSIERLKNDLRVSNTSSNTDNETV